MFTFGYKTKFSSLLRALAAIGIGLVMILGTNAPLTIVKVIAAFLFAAGVISFVYGFAYRKGEFLPLMITNAVVDVVLGLLLFLFPEQVAGFIVYLIGILLLLFGVLQLVVLAGAMNLVGARFTSLILSISAILGGAFLLFNPFSMKVMSLIAGCLLVIYGISEIFSTWQVGKAKKAYEIKSAPKPAEPASESGKVETPGIGQAKEVNYQKAD